MNREDFALLFPLGSHLCREPMPDGRETDRAGFFTLEELAALEEPVDEFCAWITRRVMEGRTRLLPPEPGNPYRPHLAFF